MHVSMMIFPCFNSRSAGKIHLLGMARGPMFKEVSIPAVRVIYIPKAPPVFRVLCFNSRSAGKIHMASPKEMRIIVFQFPQCR